MGFGAIIAKKKISSPKSVYSKDCISGSQGGWTLGLCMEAIKSLNSFYQHYFWSRKPFLTLRPLEHTKSGKYGQNANIGTYIPMGHQSPYNMAYTQIEGPIVSVCKRTYYGSSPPLGPKSIMYAYGHVCKTQVRRACAQGNII